MADFPHTVEVDGQPFTIQAPIPSHNGATYQVLDAAGESMGAIEITEGKAASPTDPTLKRVIAAAIAHGIMPR